MKKNFLKLGVGLLIIFGISGCYPEGFETYEETDIVVTDYNPDYDFSSVGTFYMPDTIHHIGEEEPDREWDSFVLGEIETGFENLGYTKIDVYDMNNPPDVVVDVSILEVDYTQIYSYPYWPGYGYPYYPGYGWGYPWYGYGYYYQFTTGTIFWNMWDPDNVDEVNEIIPIEYVALINGLVANSSNPSMPRIAQGIEKAFAQSPYL